MGFVLAAIIAAAVGLSAKEGVFKKGYDTTRVDTVAFERHALEMKLARLQTKQREVVELNTNDAGVQMKQAKLTAREAKLESKIAELENLEEKLQVNN